MNYAFLVQRAQIKLFDRVAHAIAADPLIHDVSHVFEDCVISIRTNRKSIAAPFEYLNDAVPPSRHGSSQTRMSSNRRISCSSIASPLPAQY